MKIDLNADVGEGDDDAPLYPLVSSVNIACGGHAGDDETMARAVELALKHGVTAGAHPGYEDREHAGRAPLNLTAAEVRALIVDQVARLSSMAKRAGTTLAHVKPHGALYNQAAVDRALASAVAGAVRAIHPRMSLVALAGSMLGRAGRDLGLSVVEEGFADRRYKADGTLVPRSDPGALITAPEQAAAQAVSIARGVPIWTIDRKTIALTASTICLHADTPGAIDNARAVRAALETAGFVIAAP